MTSVMAGAGLGNALARIDQIISRFEPGVGAGTDVYSDADFATLLAQNNVNFNPSATTSYGLTNTGEALVAQGMSYLGVPYLWGGTDPDVGLDCSGFTQRVFKDLGIDIPRVSRDQARGGQAVASLDEARPGDILAFGSPVNHVAIYAGDGMMVHSPRRGDVVTYEAIDRPITAIRRYTPSASTPLATGGAIPGWSAVSMLGNNQAANSLGVAGVPQAYAAYFSESGSRYGVDPKLLAAVAKVESGFNPNAKSSAGALGLMQFMPETAASMGIDPLDPRQAIDGAARYLRAQLDDFGSLDLALAAYNAGPGAVRKHGGIPPYSQTQTYVAKVQSILNGGN